MGHCCKSTAGKNDLEVGDLRFRMFAWYLDITPSQMFSLYEYPIPGKDGLPLCKKHGKQLEVKELVDYDKEATEASPPNYCWVCKE